MMYGIGERLKELRRNRDMTQLEVASLLSVTKAMISAYENETRFPSFEVIIKIAQRFNVTTDYLLGLEKKKNLDISSLTDQQVKIVFELVNEFKILNENTKK